MNIARFFKALWNNMLLLLIIALIYALLVITSITVDSSPHEETMHYREVDVVFVFDTTGSMQDKIDGLLDISAKFAYKLEEQGSDYRLAMVCFGALEEDSVIREVFYPSDSLDDFQAFLKTLNDYGGGREDQITAIRYAITQLNYRSGVQKVLILITDEPLYGWEAERAGEPLPLEDWGRLVNELQRNQFTAFSVSPDEKYFREMAAETGGRFYDIEKNRNFTDILIIIAEEINASLTR
jgi:hypothetical protein